MEELSRNNSGNNIGVPRKSILERRRLARWNHELERKDIRRARRFNSKRVKKHHKKRIWYRNRVLTYLRSKLNGKDISYYHEQEKAWVIPIPSDFSFITNTEETLNVLYSIVAASNKEPYSIFIDHSKCKNMDLGASAVLDVITLSIRQEWRVNTISYHIAGRYPDDSDVMAVIACMGITKHLKATGMQVPKEVEEQFVKFELLHGRRQAKDRILAPSSQEKAATDLALYLNGCFEKASGYSFKGSGKKQVVQWAGELITNAEEHSEQAEWYSIAYMKPVESAQIEDGTQAVMGECHLVVFNFGRSIYESLSSEDTPVGTREQISNLVNKHASKGFFGIGQYNPEDLWTLYALQDGVSRFAETPGSISRGKGTVKMIQAFQTLGETLENDDGKHPEMALVSGKTCIRFDQKYKLVPVSFPGGERFIVAFNENNSLEEKPDRRNVSGIGGFFPGTLLTFRFYIDRRYLDKTIKTPPATEGGSNDKKDD